MLSKIKKIDFAYTKTILGIEIIPIQQFLKNPHDILCNPHCDNFYAIVLIKDGQGKINLDFKTYHFNKRSVFTISPYQIQQYQQPLNFDGFLIIFTQEFIIKSFNDKEVFTSLLIFNYALQSPHLLLNNAEQTNILTLISKMYEEQQSNLIQNYKEGILRSFLHILLLKLEQYKLGNSTCSTSTQYFQDFIQFKKLIDKQIKHNRSVLTYSKELGVSTKKLNYICQSIVHKPAKEFIDDIALLHIKRDLLLTKSAKETAYNFNFDEPTNFIKYFKKNAHTLPLDFIKKFTL